MMGISVSPLYFFAGMWSTRIKVLDLFLLLASIYLLRQLSNQLSYLSSIQKGYLHEESFSQQKQMPHMIQSPPILLSKTNRNIWMVLINNDYVSNTIGTTGEWEPLTTKYLERNVCEGDIVVEAGANIGYYTALLGTLVGNGGKVYSFEANKETYELATLTLKMNDLHSHVQIQNVAIANSNGFANLTYQPISSAKSMYINTGGSHLQTKNSKPLSNSITVRTVTLDSALPFVMNVSWLRMDIEGAEIMAIEGAQRIIQQSPNIKILMEWNRLLLEGFSDVSRFIDSMHQEGFKFYRLGWSSENQKPLSKEMLLSMGQTDEDLLLTRSHP